MRLTSVTGIGRKDVGVGGTKFNGQAHFLPAYVGEGRICVVGPTPPRI